MAKVYTDIRVTALSTDELAEFIKLLSVIQFLGEAGCNREIKLRVDGDGSGRYQFELDGKSLETPPINPQNIPAIYLGE